jgi:hypothetical protein
MDRDTPLSPETDVLLTLVSVSCNTMGDASITIKSSIEPESEIERFLDETGIYTNKSGFIKQEGTVFSTYMSFHSKIYELWRRIESHDRGWDTGV